jgi:hypothetical protein
MRFALCGLAPPDLLEVRRRQHSGEDARCATLRNRSAGARR